VTGSPIIGASGRGAAVAGLLDLLDVVRAELGPLEVIGDLRQVLVGQYLAGLGASGHESSPVR